MSWLLLALDLLDRGIVLNLYQTNIINGQTMSRLLPEFEKAKGEPVSKEQDLSIEQEIECPRCHDVMTLCSEFDRLATFASNVAFRCI